MASIVLSIISGLFSALIAIFSTILVEKLGGVVGGCLSTTPILGVAFSIGIALSSNQEQLERALYAVPPSLAVSSLYLSAFREFPLIPFVAQLNEKSPLQAIMVTTSILLTLWSLCAYGLVLLLPALDSQGVSVQITGIVGSFTLLAVGLLGLFFRNPSSSTARNKVTLITYLLRGVLAGSVISISVLLSNLSPTLAGVFSVFPTISTTTIVSTWYSQNVDLPRSAINSMILGNFAVCLYAIMFATCWPSFVADTNTPVELALTANILVCWSTTSLFVSVPMFFLIQSRKFTDANKIHEEKLLSSASLSSQVENSSQAEKGDKL